MALIGRIKEVKPINFFNHFKRYYFQIHTIPKSISDYNGTFRLENVLHNQAGCRRREGFLDFRVRFFAAPVQVVKKVEGKVFNRLRLNNEIDAQFVRLVTNEGHDVVSIREAQRRAQELNFDLVEVDRNAKPPVCRLMDYHREMYKKQVKGKEKAKLKAAGSLKAASNKEVRFSAKAELKDIKIKADGVKRLMERGYRVKCTAVAAKGKDGAEGVCLSKLISQISALMEDVALVEVGPVVDEKQAYFIVRHIKFGPSKKGNKAPKIASSKSGIKKEYSAGSGVPFNSEDQIHAGESGTDYDDEDSDLDLHNEVKAPFQPQTQKFTPNAGLVSQPNVGPVSQPENRYARKVPNNASPVRNAVTPNNAPQTYARPVSQSNARPVSQPNVRPVSQPNIGPVSHPNMGPSSNPNSGPVSQPENRYAKKVQNRSGHGHGRS